MKLSGKITACAAGGVVLATLASIGTVYSISRNNRINELRELMSSTIQQAETVTENMDALHRSGAFDVEALRKGVQGAKDFRSTTFYRAVPVVAGWDSLRKVIASTNSEFVTPSHPDVAGPESKKHNA